MSALSNVRQLVSKRTRSGNISRWTCIIELAVHGILHLLPLPLSLSHLLPLRQLSQRNGWRRRRSGKGRRRRLFLACAAFRMPPAIKATSPPRRSSSLLLSCPPHQQQPQWTIPQTAISRSSRRRRSRRIRWILQLLDLRIHFRVALPLPVVLTVALAVLVGMALLRWRRRHFRFRV